MAEGDSGRGPMANGGGPGRRSGAGRVFCCEEPGPGSPAGSETPLPPPGYSPRSAGGDEPYSEVASNLRSRNAPIRTQMRVIPAALATAPPAPGSSTPNTSVSAPNPGVDSGSKPT